MESGDTIVSHQSFEFETAGLHGVKCIAIDVVMVGLQFEQYAVVYILDSTSPSTNLNGIDGSVLRRHVRLRNDYLTEALRH